MAEHESATKATNEKAEQKHRVRQHESQPSFDKSLAWGQGLLSLTETPFHPRMDEHAATLSRIPFPMQRHEFIMRLNNTYGYRYVQRLVESVKAQAKLTVSNPNDIYEQEADRVAEDVTRSINTPVRRQTPEEEEELQMQEEEEELQTTLLLQRKDEEEELLQGKLVQQLEDEELLQDKFIQRQTPEEEEELVQGKLVHRQVSEEEEELIQGTFEVHRQDKEEEKIQTQPDEGATTTVADDIEVRINSNRGGGQPLVDEARQPMEQAFGTDFSDVRIHTDSEADTLNQELSAKAFTTGRDIFFRDGEYSPGSDTGQKLIAHELTHVVQQGSGRMSRRTNARKMREGGDTVEHDGDSLANKFSTLGKEGGITATVVQRNNDPPEKWRGKPGGIIWESMGTDFSLASLKREFGAYARGNWWYALLGAKNGETILQGGAPQVNCTGISSAFSLMARSLGIDATAHTGGVKDQDNRAYITPAGQNLTTFDRQTGNFEDNRWLFGSHTWAVVNGEIWDPLFQTDQNVLAGADEISWEGGDVLYYGGKRYERQPGKPPASVMQIAKNFLDSTKGAEIGSIKSLRHYIMADVSLGISAWKEVQEVEKGGWWSCCYLTTACVEARGLPDDCHELTVLRQFRDGYMRSIPEGEALIYEYYEKAPRILARLRLEPNASEQLDQMYRRIVEVVKVIEAGRNAEALATYKEIALDLERQYNNPHPSNVGSTLAPKVGQLKI